MGYEVKWSCCWNVLTCLAGKTCLSKFTTSRREVKLLYNALFPSPLLLALKFLSTWASTGSPRPARRSSSLGSRGVASQQAHTPSLWVRPELGWPRLQHKALQPNADGIPSFTAAGELPVDPFPWVALHCQMQIKMEEEGWDCYGFHSCSHEKEEWSESNTDTWYMSLLHRLVVS